MFTVADRERVRDRIVERARADRGICGVAITGSAARGEEDRWSDLDVYLGVEQGADFAVTLAEWSAWIVRELGALHHFDVHAGPVVYRVFLLPGGLELDVGFARAEHFGARGPRFRVVFGTPIAQPTAPGVDVDDLVGRGWHHLLHARVSIERGRLWQAEHWISAVRDITLVLACHRLGERTDFAKGAHRLPSNVTQPLVAALVRSIEADELRRALAAASKAFRQELQMARPTLAAALGAVLDDMTSESR